MGDYSALYPEDYFSSRQRFQREVKRLSGTVTSLALNKHSGEPQLSIDVALLGDPVSNPTIMYIAGTHGIEGFMGQAIQASILSQLTLPPRGYALALVHCLNPWGMAYLRRTNRNNVDLNRNCNINDDERSGAPTHYDNLRHLLMPHRALSFPAFCLKALSLVVKHGYPAAKQAITGGQYIDPKGLFFGGHSLQEELTLLRSWALEHLAQTKRVLVVDLHSGLGSFGEDTLIVDDYDDTKSDSLIRRIFPDRELHGPNPSKSLAYDTSGSLSSLLTPILPKADLAYVVHEFGTLHSFKVLYALVQENYYHFLISDSEINRGGFIGKKLLTQAFCPSDKTWRQKTAELGLKLFQEAVRGISLLSL